MFLSVYMLLIILKSSIIMYQTLRFSVGLVFSKRRGHVHMTFQIHGSWPEFYINVF